MRAFITGATGHVGEAVANEFLRAGYDVLGLARTDASADRLRDQGVEPVAGDIRDLRSLVPVIATAGVVVHAAFTFDEQAADAELAAIAACGEALTDSSQAFVYTSGLWVLGDVGPEPATEDTPVAPIKKVAFRPRAEHTALALARHGVRASVVRPGVVHGDGGGLLRDLVDSGRRLGCVRYVGDGSEYWPMIHRNDLAVLYRLAAEEGRPGAIWHGVTEEGIELNVLAEVAAEVAGVPGRVKPWPLEEARRELGDLAEALAVSQRVSADRARRELGWRPCGPDALTDLRTSYA